MNVLITGGNGFIGQKLAAHLLSRGIQHQGQTHKVEQLTLCDVQHSPAPIADQRIDTRIADISEISVAHELITETTDIIFHLAAVVSSQAEADFPLGMKINFGGTRNLLEACRSLESTPRFIFASSAAVYGGDMPEVLVDSTLPNPQSSYGTQKLMCEMLVNDYSRKGFIDGYSLRLPTVSVRPGKPNAAASSFASSIIREPLNGETANCPIKLDTLIWLTSPRTVVGNIAHATSIDSKDLGASRSIPLPGTTVTAGEMLESLELVAGANVRGLVTNNAESAIEQIVYSWPGRFLTEKADALGFSGDSSFDDTIRQYMQDELS